MLGPRNLPRHWLRHGWLAALCLSLRLAAAPADEPVAEFIPAPPPTVHGYRYLVVVESSAAMDKLRDRAADFVSREILGAFNGHATTNDLAGLWVIGRNLTNTPLSQFVLSATNRIDVSNLAYRYVRELRSDEKLTNLNSLFLELIRETSTGQQLTLYLVTSGSQPILGTAFDESINTIFATHGKAMRKKGIPFVTVLLSEGSRWVAHAVTPADRKPFVPRFPKRPPPQPAPPPAAAQPRMGEPLIYVGTNRIRSLSPDEIRQKVREAQSAAPTNPPPASTSP